VTAPLAIDETLDGVALRRIFGAASSYLRTSAKAIDAINVYPVPDGDTGSNMSATLREAVDRTMAVDGEPGLAEVLSVLSRGALYGARGNSGVILSQALRGFATGVGAVDRLDGVALTLGLEAAATQAYRAVGNPQEGTMLTVLRAAAEGARAELTRRGGSAGCIPVLGSAVAAAESAEAETINQLPSLKEAGVTDAGGEGVCVILRGLFAAITGREPAPPHVTERPISLERSHDGEAFGFCTEFLVEAADGTIDLDALRALAESNGSRSVVVVGDEMLARVHAHSQEPQALLDGAEAFGRVSRSKVENMDAQNARFEATGSGAGAKVALLAMSRGDGFDDIFESLGATVSDLGLVEKPPAGQIAAAADELRVPDVIVLANHKNVLLAAEQAKTLTSSTLHVVPTTTLPQGVAAAMAFDPQESSAENVRAMAAAAAAVTTVEVTIAGASRTIDGVTVVEGHAIALVDGKLVATAEAASDALLRGIRHAAPGKGALITLYPGEDTDEAGAAAALEAIRAEFPAAEVESVNGGQPLYPFIASLE